MDKIDIVIIGAGVVGLAIAQRLSADRRSLYVIERHDSFGRETSSRNSEVIHAGIYYPAGSLKARLCVEGNASLYEICLKFKINFKKTGKLIVATNQEEENILDGLLKKGKKNGVRGLEIISKKQVNDIEPNICATAALWSHSTGIIDSHSLMQYFADCIKENGGVLAYNSQLTAISKRPDGYELTVKDSRGEEFKFCAKLVINSAGLTCDEVARMAGKGLNGGYSLHYCKGQYFRVNDPAKSKLINRLVYPVPEEYLSGLGIHATIDLAGGLRLGPDSRYISRDEVDYSVDVSQRKNFFESVAVFLPFLKEDDLIADTAGIRPKLQGPGEGFRDFIIKEESGLGLPGFINLIGIESPGLTCSPAIARAVEELTRGII